jgi:hypothetical protein
VRLGAALAFAAIICALPTSASAQVRLQTEASARQIEVGENVQVQLTALTSSEDEVPSNPKLVAPPSVTVRGPSVSSQTQVSIVNGRMSRSVGITVTWTLSASRPGKFRIGPPSVEVQGKRQQGDVIELEVLAPGTLPRRGDPRRGPGFDPFDFFDPFGRSPFPRGLLDPNSDDFADDLPPVPPEFQLDRAPDRTAFVRVRTTPEKVVVGQQVTFDIYGYGGRGPYRVGGVTEPSRPDFLAYAIEDSDQSAVRVPIGDDVFLAQRLRQYALFPLKAGKLTVGPVEVLFGGDRYATRKPLTRASEPLEIVVVEPPLAGRPPGYRVGDVGQYTLSATVEPRRIQVGEAVSVVARLEGIGNVPLTLNVPQQHGVEWLEPNVVADVEPKGNVVRGFRSFTYVVKLTEAGSVDLGELALPFYNPTSERYEFARAELGKVEVVPGAGPKSTDAAEKSTLEGLGKVRDRLEPLSPEKRYLTDQPWFLWLVFGAPLGVVLTDGGLRLWGLLKRRASAKKDDPRLLAESALNHASRLPRNEATKAPALVERALFLAIEAGTGLRARALLRSDLRQALERAGVPADRATAVVALLDDCEKARFTADASGSSASEWVLRAEPLTRALLRQKPRASS